MSEEPIVIEIIDKVAPSISAKLKDITTNARKANSSIESLKSALNDVSYPSGFDKIQSALAKTATANQRLQIETDKTNRSYLATEAALNRAVAAEQRALIESQRLQAAMLKTEEVLAKTATAEVSLATASQRLATEQQRTATTATQSQIAMVNLGAATERASASQSRAQIAALKLQQVQDRAASSGGRMAAEAEALKRSLYPLYDAQQRHNDAVQAALALYKAGEINVKTYTDAVNRSAERMQAATIGGNAFNEGLAKTGKASQLTRHHLLNLGFQVQDVGVSLASGQNPLTVFIQQGAQIAGIASQAGVGIGRLALAAGALLLPFTPLVAALGAAYAAFKLFTSEVEKEAGLKKYVETLGLTASETKRLKDVSITFGDVMSGVWKTIDNATGAGEFFTKIADYAKKGFLGAINYAILAGQSIVAILRASVNLAVKLWDIIPYEFKRIFENATGVAKQEILNFANISIDYINKIIQAVNKVSAIEIKPIEKIKFEPFDYKESKTDWKKLLDEFSNDYANEIKGMKKSTSDLFKEVKDNVAQSAQDRLKKQADQIKADRNLEFGGAEKVRTFADVIQELQRELDLLNMSKLDADVSKLTEGINLTKAQSNEVKKYVEVIEDANIANQAYGNIYNQVKGPQLEYGANIKAINKLFKEGKIDSDSYHQQIEKSKESFENAKDPMRGYKKALEDELAVLKELPEKQEQRRELLRIENYLIENGTQNRDLLLKNYKNQLETVDSLSKKNEKLIEIYLNTKGALKEITNTQEAYTQALANGNLSLDAYNAKMVQLGISAADVKNKIGLGDVNDVALGSFDGILNGFTTLADGISNSIEQMFSSLTDGVSNSLAAAIVKGDDLRASMHNISEAILTELLSSLIKVGIQYTVNAALQNSANSAVMAANKAKEAATISSSLVSAKILAGAWAPAAAAVSSATQGANAVPANAGLSSTFALSKTLSAATGYKEGGYTGDFGKDKVAGVVHGREFVMNAEATSRIGVANLQALQSGASNVRQSSNQAGTVSVGNAPVAAPAPIVNVPFNAVVVQSKEAALASLKTSEGRAFIIETIEQNGSAVARIVGVK